MLDTFCHKLGLFATRWACDNAREWAMKALVHFFYTKRKPTQAKGFIQIDLFRF